MYQRLINPTFCQQIKKKKKNFLEREREEREAVRNDGEADTWDKRDAYLQDPSSTTSS